MQVGREAVQAAVVVVIDLGRGLTLSQFREGFQQRSDAGVGAGGMAIGLEGGAGEEIDEGLEVNSRFHLDTMTAQGVHRSGHRL